MTCTRCDDAGWTPWFGVVRFSEPREHGPCPECRPDDAAKLSRAHAFSTWGKAIIFPQPRGTTG